MGGVPASGVGAEPVGAAGVGDVPPSGVGEKLVGLAGLGAVPPSGVGAVPPSGVGEVAVGLAGVGTVPPSGVGAVPPSGVGKTLVGLAGVGAAPPSGVGDMGVGSPPLGGPAGATDGVVGEVGGSTGFAQKEMKVIDPLPSKVTVTSTTFSMLISTVCLELSPS